MALNQGMPAVFSSLFHEYFLPIKSSESTFQSQNATVVPLENDSPSTAQVLITITDVTHIAQRAHKYKELHERIKKEVTEHEKTKQQLIQKEKLASLGTFCAGIAHELNNPLTVVTGFTKLIQKNPGDSDMVLERSTRIQAAAFRMQSIIERLCQFACENHDEKWTTVDLNYPLKNSLALLQNKIESDDITVLLELEPKPHFILGDQSQLERVFQNLLLNSYDAFATLHDRRLKWIKIKTINIDDGIRVIYEDNAGGMTDAVKQKLFDPFFTTKEVGQGTGLGLSILHGIIAKHKGTVRLDNPLKAGSLFEIDFPGENSLKE